jgi:hypothetical protein
MITAFIITIIILVLTGIWCVCAAKYGIKYDYEPCPKCGKPYCRVHWTKSFGPAISFEEMGYGRRL